MPSTRVREILVLCLCVCAGCSSSDNDDAGRPPLENISVTAVGDGPSRKYYLPDGAGESNSVAPPLSAVLLHAEGFLESKVTLFGYLHGLTESHSALYISQDHALYGDHSSSVIVPNGNADGPNLFELCGGQYVRVTGTLGRSDGYSLGGLGRMIVIGDPSRVTVAQANGEKPQCWPPPIERRGLVIPPSPP